MPVIEVTAANFLPPHAGLNGVRDVRWELPALVHAAMTVGKLPPHVLQHGPWSLMELLSRASLVLASLRARDGRFIQSGVYRFADRSEKGATSYFLGQTLASLFVRRFLACPYVMHVDRYWQQLEVVWNHPHRRPDLIGWGPIGWVVIEAKGRTHGLDAGVLANAAMQKGVVASIGGLPPNVLVASVAHFAGGVLSLHVEDPPAEEPVEVLDGDPGSFLRTYYEPFVAAAETGIERFVLNRRVLFADVTALDLQVGVDVEVVDAFRSSDSALDDLGRQLPREVTEERLSNEFRRLGPDGIAVELGPSWSEELFHLEPWLRGR